MPYLAVFEKLNLNEKNLNYLIGELFKEELLHNSEMLDVDFESIKNLVDKENTDLIFLANKFKIQNFIKIGLKNWISILFK